jgi:hypothetical protein
VAPPLLGQVVAADGEHFRLLLHATMPDNETGPMPLGLTGFPEPR